VYISDDEEDQEIGKRGNHVSSALGEQQQGVADHGRRSEWQLCV